MAITTSYLNSGARSRSMTTESDFSLGMKYTETPLDEGYSRVLLNYALSDNGSSLKPRAGLEHVRYLTSMTTNNPILIHHSASALFSSHNGADTVMCKYLLYGQYDTDGLDLSTLNAVCLYNGEYIMSSSTNFTDAANSTALKCEKQPDKIHGITNSGQPHGIYTVIDGNTYVLSDAGLCRLEFKFNAQYTAFTIYLHEIVPNEINAAKAVNNGYNMLLSNPYSFSITTTSAGVLVMDGIVPYDSTGTKVKLNARIGDEICFKLYYRYPTSDTSARYLAQWELQDTETGESRLLQSCRNSSIIVPGSPVNYTTNQTTYKQFTLICKLYKKSEVDAVPFVSDALDSVNLKPIGVMSVAYYYFTDTKGSTQNASTDNYDLNKATGMCDWQQRLVMWGVPGCKNTIWISEVNDPSYFPYPNGIELFDDDIVGAVKWKTNLIVFTKSAVYQLAYADDGVTITSKCIQNRMMMEEGEACTIIPVQNMIFFKNDNYYYMVVPSGKDTTSYGELTLAPISKPITNLLDNFSENVFDLLPDVTSIDPNLYGYDTYLEGSNVRIVYKIYVTDDNFKKSYRDIVLQYDTKSRTWTTLSYDSDKWQWVQFIRSVTADSVFAAPVQTASGTWTIDLLQANPSKAKDEYSTTIYDVLGDYVSTQDAMSRHLLDTGYRKLNDYNNLNKKWRQIKFDVTNFDREHLKFATEIIVDNWMRKPIEYEVDTEDGVTTVTPVYDEICSVEEKQDYVAEWGLDPDLFDAVRSTVKINTNGKGKYIKFRISDNNDSMYDINSITYVFRVMTGR